MMQKCTDAAFCNRLLGTKDEGYIIDPASVHVAGAKLSAKVLNQDNPNVNLTLTLTAYGSFLRMHVNEDSSKGRFEVPGVLHKNLPQIESSNGNFSLTPLSSLILVFSGVTISQLMTVDENSMG